MSGMAEAVLKFRTSEVPRQEGEYARIRVLKGPDMGSVFIIKNSAITVGRGDDSTLKISDLKASRTHAKIEYTRTGWRVTDLGSSNGIFYRGEYVRDFMVKSGDHFTVGESILEFLLSHESNKLLSAPIVDDPDLERRDVELAHQKLKVRSAASQVKIVPRPGTKKKPPFLLIAVGICGLAYSFPEYSVPLVQQAGFTFLLEYLPPDPNAKTQTAKKGAKKDEKKDESRDLASYLPPEVTSDVGKTAEQYFQEGFREYRAGNYLRARDSFQLALQMNPAHDRANFYLNSANRESEEEIKRLMDSGLRSIQAGRFGQARAFYEMALRRLPEDDENSDVKTCKNALKDINKAGGGL
ncbi:MAG: FHA domain-containing protein [Proteobacteria bacterium]|nr:FHA domain-containing protein [Pseudomonadota bacterium]